ncbi:agamous-like MADS-box protein AGL62 [Argentina anserina]|uniref:agamous-like MADS-box protein AGL62 n=1 Tax=Argentina anserina TaxID=57926 RepID=UPI0021764DE5|nr:agamous-like MADS-box protein AGL62 [Potentilla anserina]
MVRKSKGRQKVEMVKMANDSNLQVTFSKRRSGLFKKASELCTLCGAEVAIIVFSPGRKVFSFGHPCVESVVERFLTRNPSHHHQNSGTMQLIEAHRNANVRELNAELTQVTNDLETERKRGEELNRVRKASQGQCWWESPIEEMEMPHCEQLGASLEELKKSVAKQIDKLIIQSTTNPNPFFAGSSGNLNLVPNMGFSGVPVMPPHPHAWNPAYGRFL